MKRFLAWLRRNTMCPYGFRCAYQDQCTRYACVREGQQF